MYVDSSTLHRNGKTYTRHLLRECYRENGKIMHRTVANISHCSPEEIEALRIGLRRKKDPTFFVTASSNDPNLHIKQGPSLGALWVVHSIAKELGIVDALGHSRNGKLALWQVCARLLDQGSRLSAVRLAETHAACDVLGLDGFTENALYANLDWLCENQEAIEDRLFARLPRTAESGLYLYDVTSSYFEGEQNELAAFGYNRDGKKHKRQIVLGLLCNAEGIPLSIEVFPGNTSDPKTVASQVKKVRDRFGGGQLTLVGDRGMLRGPQIDEMPDDFSYITAITKPQIETLLVKGVLQMSLFDQPLAEVFADDGIRYVLRRNPIRAEEMAANRADKERIIAKAVDASTTHLKEHPKAKPETQARALEAKIAHLKASAWITLQQDDRSFSIRIDKDARAEAARLDGCYVIKTDLPEQIASKEIVHSRYRDLAMVEQAFRISKTTELELRPIHVRLESRTRGHALVVMLAYRIAQELANRWSQQNCTVQEALNSLALVTTQEVTLNNAPPFQVIPEPSDANQSLLKAANITLPPMLTHRNAAITTTKQLPSRRTRRGKTRGYAGKV